MVVGATKQHRTIKLSLAVGIPRFVAVGCQAFIRRLRWLRGDY